MATITTINRKNPPAYKTVDKVDLIKAQSFLLPNKTPIYYINAGSQELVKIEFLFDAGTFYQQMPLQASSTNSMMEEGTSKMNAQQIAEAIDFYGAFLETGTGQDNASITLYTLNKHLLTVLPIVEQVIKEASFPKKEFEIFIKNKKQKFLVDNQKVATIARRKFMELIFGDKNPYGTCITDKDFDSINTKHLESFYKQHYTANNCKIIVSGKVDDIVLKALEKHFGNNDWLTNNLLPNIDSSIKTNTQKEVVIEKKDALQSAIRIGKTMFNKTHPDFLPFLVLNTILGGYFGSRLMSNIREDKGYTYGIGSNIVSLKNGGYFFISTEVGVDVCKNAVNEIYHELNKLKEKPVEEEELETVKNYMTGTFLRSIDGPFALADRFKAITEYGLDYDYYDKYIATIKNISASELRELANKYFDKESMYELVAGKK